MMENRLQAALTAAAGLFLLLFCLGPLLWMVMVSLSRHPDFLATGSTFGFTLTNYRDILAAESTPLLRYLFNSLVVSVVSALFSTMFAGLSAYAITRMRFPGRVIIPALMLAFSMFPQISIVGYLFKLMTSLGWINTYQGLVLPYITLGMPLALWIMLSHFSQLPGDLDRAAMIDGATRWQVFSRIILPVAVPGAFSAALLVFIYSFNEFLFALMLTVDAGARTVPVGIALFEGLHGQIPYGHIMAAAVVSTIPVLLLALFFQRRIVSGLTQGAVKG